ncbi:alpha-galactosidase A-like [Amblyomma americanum]
MASKVAAVSLCFGAFALLVTGVRCLDNGLALTPPMGWLTWSRFMCNECALGRSENCLTSDLILQMADKMVEDGYLDAGYEYVMIDDCWSATNRDVEGRLFADPRRFPEGMKKLVEEVHKKGLKFGIYADIGSKTCGGFPGSYGHYATDAQTFADWKVDYVKVDGCNAKASDMDTLYPEMGQALRDTGRDMVYSCEWPFYQIISGMLPDYKNISKNCNLWRNYFDINYSWQQIYNIVNYEASVQDPVTAVTGPGAWNDPDMLVIGNFGLTIELQRAHMAYWAIMAAPLIMSNDLRDIPEESKELLLNKYIIAVDQDPLGLMGRRVYKANNLDVWARWVTPQLSSGKKSLAVLVHNTKVLGGPVAANISLVILGLDSAEGYLVTDLIRNNTVVGKVLPGDSINATVAPLDVFFFKATVLE